MTVQSVPTNIITGFLGVGKTSAILSLLENKPDDERWAVLVNEFGEIGIDGGLIGGRNSEESGVYVREVPGGCMCCAAGLPMRIALNMLLTRAKPDRLLIEPTGLGHPREVIAELQSPDYLGVIELQAVVTLVDARNLGDSRYTDHDIFNQQLEMADVVVANKLDLYGDRQAQLLADLEAYLASMCNEKSLPQKPLFATEQGALQAAWMKLPRLQGDAHGHHHHHQPTADTSAPELQLLEPGEVRSVANSGEGFETRGWQFSPEQLFSRERLFSLLSGLDVERAKAVFITEDGIFGYNKSRDALTEIELDDSFDSRLEVIGVDLDENLEQQLLDCMVAD